MVLEADGVQDTLVTQKEESANMTTKLLPLKM